MAGRWLDQVTRNLDTSGIVAEHTRVSFAAHQLKDDAYHWGRRVRDRVGDDDRVFETVFLDLCFPEAAREEQQQQFQAFGDLSKNLWCSCEVAVWVRCHTVVERLGVV